MMQGIFVLIFCSKTFALTMVWSSQRKTPSVAFVVFKERVESVFNFEMSFYWKGVLFASFNRFSGFLGLLHQQLVFTGTLSTCLVYIYLCVRQRWILLLLWVWLGGKECQTWGRTSGFEKRYWQEESGTGCDTSKQCVLPWVTVSLVTCTQTCS